MLSIMDGGSAGHSYHNSSCSTLPYDINRSASCGGKLSLSQCFSALISSEVYTLVAATADLSDSLDR